MYKALIPIYTGKTEEELPNVLKNDPNGIYVDEAYPFIWKELKDKSSFEIYFQIKRLRKSGSLHD